MWQKLLEFDAQVSKRLHVADRPGLLRRLAIFFAHSGDSWFWFLGLGLLWWLGTAYWKNLALAFLLSILATAVFVLTIKFIVRRRRPEGEWGDVYRMTDPHSFPSGHAARAALLAVLALGLGPTWFGILVLIWAPLVILARVAMGVHYALDVLAGTLLGVLIGLGVLYFLPPLSFPV